MEASQQPAGSCGTGEGAEYLPPLYPSRAGTRELPRLERHQKLGRGAYGGSRNR